MKKTLLAICFLLTIKVDAQINLEHTYPSQPGLQNAILINIGNNNWKYYTLDVNTNNLNLYNIDHTPYMTINIPVSLGSTGFYGVGYITNSLFDCDSSNIEYAVLRSSPCDTTKFRIFRSDGTLLFSKDSATTPYCYGCTGGAVQINGIRNTNDGTKLLLITCSGDIAAYSLCGTLPDQIDELFQESSYVKVFPNPSSQNVTFEIDPPDNFYQYKLLIYNSSFQTLMTFEVNGYMKIDMDTGNLSSDTYFYSLQSNNKVFQSSKFTISK